MENVGKKCNNDACCTAGKLCSQRKHHWHTAGSQRSPTWQPAVDVTLTITSERTTQPADMDFNGTWKVYSEENLEEFLKVIGKMMIKMHFLSPHVLKHNFQGRQRWWWRCVKMWNQCWWSSRTAKTLPAPWRLRSPAASPASPSGRSRKSAPWTAGRSRWAKPPPARKKTGEKEREESKSQTFTRKKTQNILG